jgi:hypothetical protein
MSQKKIATDGDQPGFSLKLTGALLLLGVAGAFLYFLAFGGRQKPDLKQFGAAGEYAAEETVKVIGKSGRIVLVYDIYDPKTDGSEAGKAFADQGVQAAAFRKRLAKLGNFTFAPDWKLARPNMVFRSVWPDGAFAKLVSANSPESTLVLFANPPALTKDEKSLLQSRPGKLVLIGGALPEVQWFAKERLAHLIVASRYPVPPPTKKLETEREVTRRVYAAVTPETASQP